MSQIRALLVVVLAAACGGGAAKSPVAAKPAPAPSEPGAKAIPITPEQELADQCEDVLSFVRKGQKFLGGKDVPRTVGDVLVPLNLTLVKLSNMVQLADFYGRVHPNEAMRRAGEVCSQKGQALESAFKLDRALYDTLEAVDVTGADADTKRFRELFLRDMRRAGVDKDEATRAKLAQLEADIIALELAFNRNISEDTRKVKVAKAALTGLPADYIAAHPPDADGNVTITTDYPDYFPFRTYAKDAAARKAVYVEYMNRGYPANQKVLLDLLAKRQERAKLLGYPTFADYITEDKMIGSAKNAQEFIDKVTKLADKRMKADLGVLLAYKRKTDPKATSIGDDEARYLSEEVKRDKYAFDAQSVRPYFEFDRVRDGLLAVTARLYDVEFVRLPNEPVWHSSVTAYDVVRRGAKLGTIYLDLHPRDGKYKHAAQFTLQKGIDGTQLPKAALVCNFADPAVQKPALMDHDQVEVFFHEFGHLVHDVLGGNQKWITQSGVATEWDFVEAPSQMFEEWAWDPATLATFARHIETNEPLPPAMVTKLRAARDFGKGMDTRRQMFLASVSLATHVREPKGMDLDALTLELMEKVGPWKFVPDTHFYANFGHLAGYNAMYYTYMWSRVIAKDMFTPFEKAGLSDAATALRYRQRVLEPGGTKPAAQLVADFLGRPYRFDAYQRWLEKK